MWHLTCPTLSSAGTMVLEHLRDRWGRPPPAALWTLSSPPWVLPPTFGGAPLPSLLGVVKGCSGRDTRPAPSQPTSPPMCSVCPLRPGPRRSW